MGHWKQMERTDTTTSQCTSKVYNFTVNNELIFHICRPIFFTICAFCLNCWLLCFKQRCWIYWNGIVGGARAIRTPVKMCQYSIYRNELCIQSIMINIMTPPPLPPPTSTVMMMMMIINLNFDVRGFQATFPLLPVEVCCIIQMRITPKLRWTWAHIRDEQFTVAPRFRI